jgi:DNA modification methylase
MKIGMECHTPGAKIPMRLRTSRAPSKIFSAWSRLSGRPVKSMLAADKYLVNAKTPNALYYGDNLDSLRKHVRDETVDLCYIDPPFNSKRNYSQIYNDVGKEDAAQAQAFVDTWTWDDHADEGFQEITANEKGRCSPRTVALIEGLREVLRNGSLLAFLVSMTRRIVEIHRVLKPTGSFYLHCDPTSSHYLKIVLDSIFEGRFRNEIIWKRTSGRKRLAQFERIHDVVLFYTKGEASTWNCPKRPRLKTHLQDLAGISVNDIWTDIEPINPAAQERLGYPTQKPEALLERMIKASSNEGDTILDAYCGCGTTVAVAQRLKRNWIGMDVTYEAIALTLKRLEDAFGKDAVTAVHLSGAPKDMAPARALAGKADDHTRKEFEKWGVLTYSENRGLINGLF